MTRPPLNHTPFLLLGLLLAQPTPPEATLADVYRRRRMESSVTEDVIVVYGHARFEGIIAAEGVPS